MAQKAMTDEERAAGGVSGENGRGKNDPAVKRDGAGNPSGGKASRDEVPREVGRLTETRADNSADTREPGAASGAEDELARLREEASGLRERLEAAGLTLSGISPDGRLVETVELSDRPFFVGVQYHPEFKSRPNKPHPLFRGFIGAAVHRSMGRDQ